MVVRTLIVADPDQEKLIQKVLDMTAIPDIGQSAAKSQGMAVECVCVEGGRGALAPQ